MNEEKKPTSQPSYRIESVHERSIANVPTFPSGMAQAMDALEELIRRVINEELDKRGIGGTK